MSNPPFPRRQPRIEALEAKNLLAGDVLVHVVAGNLVVRGDDLDNQIAIHSGVEPGEYIVRGLNGTNVMLAEVHAGGDPAPAAPETSVVVTGVHGGRIGMGDGDDMVVLNHARFAGNLGIATGAGNDTVIVGAPVPQPPGPLSTDDEDSSNPEDPAMSPQPATNIRRSLWIHTGDDGDTVHVANATVGGRMDVRTGEGDDRVRLGRLDPAAGPTESDAASSDRPDSESTLPGLRVRGRLRVGLGAGSDHLAIHHVAAAGVFANGGFGDDALNVGNTRARVVALNGGMGDGSDVVHAHHLRSGLLTIQTHAGADHVAVSDSTLEALFARLGDGDDTLAIGGVSARLARLSGGPGDGDRFRDLGENRIRHMRISGFELAAAEDDSDVEKQVI